MFVGIGQGGAARRFGNPHMHQPPQATAQAIADLAQRIGASELTEQHRDELRPAGKALGVTLSGVLFYECGELDSGKVLEQLIEKACDLYDWIALLWQRLARLPARNGSPTSIIGGHSPYFRLQEPVLDNSEVLSNTKARNERLGKAKKKARTDSRVILLGARKPARFPPGVLTALL